VLLERLRQLSRTGRRLQRVAGVLLAVVGVLMITGRLEAMSYWLLETFPVLGRIG
jgi:cytochrome c-type biogenesis protein